MKLAIHKQDGTLSGKKANLSDDIFGIEPNTHAIYQAVRLQMTNNRQGTAAAKTRAAVRGGGRKPWRQKGRGTARAGTNRSPVWVGGGVVFPPSPQDYTFGLPKRVKKLARKSALAEKAKAEAIRVIEDFTIDEGKTRQMFEVLKGLGLESTKTLLLVPEHHPKTLQACQNIANLQVRIAETVSTYDLLNCRVLLIQESALKKLEGSLAS